MILVLTASCQEFQNYDHFPPLIHDTFHSNKGLYEFNVSLTRGRWIWTEGKNLLNMSSPQGLYLSIMSRYAIYRFIHVFNETQA